MRKICFILVCSVLAFGCAQQRPISGGEKDEIPPKIIASYPSNGSVNFSGNSLELEFDEYVNIQGLNQSLIISPPLSEDPEIKTSGKKVKISWKDSLAKNTTYLFQFGNGIKDLNEGNILDSNVFVFSTGSYIDSLKFRGKVLDAFTLQPVKEVKVMLYKLNIDSLPQTSNPTYYTVTDKDGTFEMLYLAKGSYKAFALEPVNMGFTYDLPNERIAFSDTIITSKNYVDSINYDSTLAVFKLFKRVDTSQYITNTVQEKNRAVSFAFNKPPENLSIEELFGLPLESTIQVWNDFKDSTTFWFPEPIDYDSLKFLISAKGLRDTVYLRKPIEKKTKEEKAEWLTLKPKDSKIKREDSFVLESKTPIKSAFLDSAILVSEGDSVYLLDGMDLNTFTLSLDFDWKLGAAYKLYLPRTSVVDYYQIPLDSSVFSFSVYKKEELGELVVKNNFPNPDLSYLWQLLSKDGKLLKSFSISADETVRITDLPVGTYQVRVVFDENNNGKWDAGFYETFKQPERIIFLDQKLDVRANWTTEIEWKVKN